MAEPFSIDIRPADDERKGWMCTFRRKGDQHTAFEPFPSAFRAAEWAVRCVGVLEGDEEREAARELQERALKGEGVG